MAYKKDPLDNEPREQTCAAYGCPMSGTLSTSTNGSHSFYCHFHFGVDSSDWGNITLRIKNRQQSFLNIVNAMRENPANPNINTFILKLEKYIRGDIEKGVKPEGLKEVLNNR